MVRQWRNDPKVSSYMLSRDHISPEQQKSWFQSVNNETNHLFIIQLPIGPVGMCGLKHIDHTIRTAESMIYIYTESQRNSLLCVAAAFMLTDYAFDTLQLQAIHANILDSNVRAIRFNKLLGYELMKTTEEGKSLYVLTADLFRTASAKTRPILDRTLATHC